MRESLTGDKCMDKDVTFLQVAPDGRCVLSQGAAIPTGTQRKNGIMDQDIFPLFGEVKTSNGGFQLLIPKP